MNLKLGFSEAESAFGENTLVRERIDGRLDLTRICPRDFAKAVRSSDGTPSNSENARTFCFPWCTTTLHTGQTLHRWILDCAFVPRGMEVTGLAANGVRKEWCGIHCVVRLIVSMTSEASLLHWYACAPRPAAGGGSDGALADRPPGSTPATAFCSQPQVAPPAAPRTRGVPGAGG